MAKKYTEPYPHISTNVSKLGVAIPCINLPALITCKADAPCRKGCYACKGNFTTKCVKTGLENNLQAFIENPDYYFDKIMYTLKAIPYRFFRYHSSGDIVNMTYLEGMVRVAKECPSTRFLCFTKKYEIVNKWLDKNHEFPNNLIMVFSHWGVYEVPNPYNLPTSHVRFRRPNEVNTNDFIPEDAIECSGMCGSCVDGSSHCWNLNKGESVCFNQH